MDVCEKKPFNFNYDLIIIITDPELIANEADAVFDRRERMDVKKPGPFFEASPNNFYLDKLTYRYDDNTNDNNLDAIEGNAKNKTKIDENEVEGVGKAATNGDADATEQGQQEYEFPMSTKEKRRLTNDNIEAELETEAANNYFHIALNNE